METAAKAAVTRGEEGALNAPSAAFFAAEPA
jgi:hypothetical protein